MVAYPWVKEDLVPEEVARDSATLNYSDIFKKMAMSKEEYWETVQGIRTGAGGFYRVRDSTIPGQVIWRVMVRGTNLIVLYCRVQRIILEFLPKQKEFAMDLKPYAKR